MNANPIVKAELTGIRQPLVDIKNRCGDTNGDGIADTPVTRVRVGESRPRRRAPVEWCSWSTTIQTSEHR